jgi:hypothetical protein
MITKSPCMPRACWVGHLNECFEFDVRDLDPCIGGQPPGTFATPLPPLWMRTPAPNTQQPTKGAHFRLFPRLDVRRGLIASLKPWHPPARSAPFVVPVSGWHPRGAPRITNFLCIALHVTMANHPWEAPMGLHFTLHQRAQSPCSACNVGPHVTPAGQVTVVLTVELSTTVSPSAIPRKSARNPQRSLET